MKRIAIFGGTFNPVQNAHVSIAIDSIKKGNLDKLIVMPDYIPPHKQTGNFLASSSDRINMLKIAFAGEENIEIGTYETENKTKSYTYLTMEHFKQIYQNDELFFIVGSDMLENFPKWKYPEKILNCCKLLYCERADEDKDDAIFNSFIALYGEKTVVKLPVKGEDVSSTKVRLYAALGLDISGFVPSGVNDYITTNGLYKDDRFCEYLKKVLPEKRRIHTAGVVLTSIKICKQLGIDNEKVALAALLHDCAKYQKAEVYKDFVLPEGVPESCIHQYLGAYVAEKVLKVTDKEVLDAIRYHTTGRANMTLTEKIVYVADVIEPSRNFDGVDELREIVFSDFEKGIKVVLSQILKFLNRDCLEVDKLTEEAVKYYCKGDTL